MKKTNPRKRPATMADVERAKKQAQDEAISLAIAVFLTVMVDKFNYDADKLKAVWDEVNKLSDSIAKGYVNLWDLKQVLADEYEIEIT